MMRTANRFELGFMIVLLVGLTGFAFADQASPVGQARPVGTVSYIKVISDKVRDVSSLEAWKESFVRKGMSDEQRALAVWRSAVAHLHQDSPPREYLQPEGVVVDPIKLFNVYGYTFCSVHSANIIGLSRYLGLQARGWTVKGHCVPEVFWDGGWHMLDASLINYFPKPDGNIASVQEIVGEVTDWLQENPDYKGNDARLRQLQRSDGWRGWRKGPALLNNCPLFSEGGWLPAYTHGWYSIMQCYDGSTLKHYESSYSLGYRVNVQLRPGERLTRNWLNKGLHINMHDGKAPRCITGEVGKGSLRYSPHYGDMAPGRVGNGTLEYDVPLANGAFRYSALRADNLACKGEDKKGPAIHVKHPAYPGVLEIRMPSSYVYLTGKLSFDAVVGKGGQILVCFSENNGLDWEELKSVTSTGKESLDLSPMVFRRYDYRLRLAMKGERTGLDSLRFLHDIQHSQRPLPALTKGVNTVTFGAGPQEGTITIEGSTKPESRDKQLVCSQFHPRLKNVEEKSLRVVGHLGEVTLPVETPGDMVRLRIGINYRARDKHDCWDVQVSYDDGNSFTTIGRCQGPRVNFGRYIVTSDIPPGTKSALVRFSGTQRNTTCIFNLRIDADYQEPFGGFRPVQITYTWEEAGTRKRHVHIANRPEQTYQITCENMPVMKSLALELAR